MAAKYAPELNDIKVVWHDLKAHHLAHQTFTDTETLDSVIHAAVDALNQERSRWADHSKKELLAIHGVGPKAIAIVGDALAAKSLDNKGD